MSAGNQSFVTLQIDEPNGRRRRNVAAVLEGDVLHMDVFELANHRQRAAFLRGVAKAAEERGAPCDVDGLEAAIVRHVREEVLGCADTNPDLINGIESSEVLAAFGLTVLGEGDDQSIHLWSENTHKVSKLKSPSNWRAAEILQVVGDDGEDILWLGLPDNQPIGTFSPLQLQLAVALEAAGSLRVSGVDRTGQGVWRHDGQVLMVDGASAYLYDGSRIEHARSPLLGRRLLDLDASKQWHGSIMATVLDTNQKSSCLFLNGLTELLNNWNWTHEWDARVLAALIVATWVQAVWHWRPLVSITGPSDCGKTTLFQELLLGIFLNKAICVDRSTEAGLRQAIRHNAMPVLIDEFDKHHQRQKVLELFRTASRGGMVLRGTADQTGQQFSLRHIAWFAAIETGNIWQQDRNRFINLELRRPNRRGVCLPHQTDLHLLGRELAAVGIWAINDAQRLADRIKSTVIEGVHGRLIESFSVPAAMYTVMSHGLVATEEQAQAILVEMISGRQTLQDQGEPDEYRLLRHILSTNLRVNVVQGSDKLYKEQSLSQLLGQYSRYQSELRAKGIGLIRSRSSSHLFLFLVPEQVSRHLLADSRWSESCIDQILLRIPNARREQQRHGAERPYGIMLPWPSCLGEPESKDVGQDAGSQTN